MSLGGGGIKPKQVTLFTRQLSTLQDAGLPIVQSLQILSDMQRPGKFKHSIATVTDDVQSGNMLSESMTRFPKIWDPLYTNLVKAGETAGALDVILRRLAEFREKAERLKKKVVGALIYPAAVMTIAGAILTFIMVFIVPKFEQIFKELGIALPGITEFLIDFSRFMADYWWVLLIGIVLIIVGIKHLPPDREGRQLHRPRGDEDAGARQHPQEGLGRALHAHARHAGAVGRGLPRRARDHQRLDPDRGRAQRRAGGPRLGEGGRDHQRAAAPLGRVRRHGGEHDQGRRGDRRARPHAAQDRRHLRRGGRRRRRRR